MLSSISPVGERARGQRFGVTAIAYLLGSVLGGAVVAGAFGAVGALLFADLPDPVGPGLLALAAMVGVAVDAGRRWRVPTLWRQVDEQWLTTFRGWVYGLGFGFQLGLGLVTVVPASATYVMLLAAALTASPASGALVGAAFGLVRALPLLATARVGTPSALRRLLSAVERARRPAARLVLVGQSVVAVAALLVVMGDRG